MKKFTVILLVLCLIFGMSACGGGEGGEGGGGIKDVASDLVSRADKMLKAQGREYDNLYTAALKEKLKTPFFEFTVNSAETADELAGYSPLEEGDKFVVVNITVTSVFEEDDIPVGNYDFTILWGDTEETSGEDVAFEEFMDGMYPDEVMLSNGETLTGDLVFEVPADQTTLAISYLEVWDDEFVGDTYLVEFTVD